MLCDQVRNQRLIAFQSNDGRALNGLSIAPLELIDDGNVAATRRSVATDAVLDYYLHTPGGAIAVDGGGLEQTIESVQISGADQDFFNAMVRRLDSILDLDFRQAGRASAADVDLYYDTEIDVGGGVATLGLATTSSQGGWELFVNYPEVQDSENYRRYVLIHEFGHSLGLEHPFEAGDGDVFNGVTDPWASAYPEDTVMAYRNPSSGTWPDFFTDNDLNALIEVWGAERQFLADGGSRFDGNGFKDDVVGGTGSDQITGASGFDFIAGGAGDDELRGGRNGDEMRGGAGNDRLFGGRGHDTLFGGNGDDVMRGGFGGDLFKLSAGNDLIEDFRFNENDRLELQVGVSFQLQQQGNDLQVITDLGTTTLYSVDQAQLLVENRIIRA